MIETKIIVKPKESGGGGSGGTSGGGGYSSDFASEAEYAKRAGKAKKAETADLAETAREASFASTAAYARKAGELDEGAEILQKFIRKDIDDEAHGLITFLQGLVSKGKLTAEDVAQFNKDARFGDFVSGMLTGMGGRIDNRGNAEFESIMSRSSIIAKELIVNRQTAMESNFFATESGIVEEILGTSTDSEGNTTYDLKLQKRWDNDFTAFHENDCIRASINTLMENGKYYDMWLRVLSVNTTTNVITVNVYPDDEVPSGKNYPPCELARLVRWGNPTDTTRQRVWYLSSETGTIILLNHVTQPIIDRSNYSIAIGLLPDALSFVFQDYPEADAEDGAIYTKWIAAQNIVKKDYEGNTKQEVTDRGLWSLDTAKSENPYRRTNAEVHDVWHYGCRWRCLEDKTTKEPRYAGTGWAFVEGNPNFVLDMESSSGWSFSKAYISSKVNDKGEPVAFTTLTVFGTLYNQDVSSEMFNVVWTRDSGEPNEDNQWALTVATYKDKLNLPLKLSDLGNRWDRSSPTVFKCTAEIKDGETTVAQSIEVEF